MENVLAILIWPLVVLILGVLGFFGIRKSVNRLIENTKKLETKVVTLITNQDDKVDAAVKTVEEAMTLRYGAFLHNTKAFSQAVEWVGKYIETHNDLDIKISAVGMAFSWKSFASNIPQWLEKNPDCNIKLCVLLVSPKYLESQPMVNFPIDWAKESRRRINDIGKMLELVSSQQKARVRLSCELRFYQGLPQYHGILLNQRELFLSRTDWIFDHANDPPNNPVFEVGTKEYRYFNSDTVNGEDRGAERIKLFSNWHHYHWKYNSEDVIKYESGKCHVHESWETAYA